MRCKICAVIFAALYVALCATGVAYADDTTAAVDDESNIETVQLSNPMWWYGQYTSDGNTLIYEDNRTSNQMSVALPGAGYVGIPILKVSYSKQFANTVFWSTDYSYLLSFTVTTAVKMSAVSSGGSIPTVDLYDEDSFALSQGRNYWDTSSIYNKHLISDIASSLDFAHTDETYNDGTYAGRTYTYNILFKMDEIPSDMGSLAYFCAFATLYGGSEEFYWRFLGWDMSCIYDPDGNITVDSPEVEDIIQGQKDAIKEGQDRELDATNNAAQDASDDGQAAASSAFNFSSFSDALEELVAALGYTGSTFHFSLPAAQNIPYIGSLWGSQEIPLKSMIDFMPVGLLYVLRFLAWLALLFSVVYFIRKLISDINGGGDD